VAALLLAAGLSARAQTSPDTKAKPAAQSAALPAVGSAEQWRKNCKNVARYSNELNFTVVLNPRGMTTNRKALLDLLDDFMLDGAPAIKAKLSAVVASVQKAPNFVDNIGDADMAVSESLGQQLHNFLDAVSAEAEKHGCKCK
jgi:hypothetical protein